MFSTSCGSGYVSNDLIFIHQDNQKKTFNKFYMWYVAVATYHICGIVIQSHEIPTMSQNNFKMTWNTDLQFVVGNINSIR